MDITNNNPLKRKDMNDTESDISTESDDEDVKQELLQKNPNKRAKLADDVDQGE
jgi:hypothetical protein